MQCRSCEVPKLSHEFPTERLTENCDHRPTWCIKCIKETKYRKCPECEEVIEEEEYRKLMDRLSLITQEGSLKPPAPRPIRTILSAYLSNTPITCTVSTMEGDSCVIPTSTGASVQSLKTAITRHFQIPAGQQRIMFGRHEVKPYIENREATLQDYNIANNSTLQLMRLMLSVNEGAPLNNVTFMLRWLRTYGERRKFLDASCFVYQGTRLYSIVDFKNTYNVTGVSHSGPAYNTSSHTMRVALNSLAGSITHLFFVMSACHVASLQDFTSPSVSLYDSARPNEQLDSFSISARGNAQSVIMCCMKRTPQGGWEVLSLGQRTEGYCYNYSPIQTTIGAIFAGGAL